jgi:hypothetical protein
VQRCAGPECQVDFEPKRSTARFCSTTCRSRAARAKRAAAESVEADAEAGKAEHALVRAVRKELADADALLTVAGQLALQVARRIADPDASGVSTLSKELRALLAEATASQPAPGGPAPDAAAEEDDEVTRARKAREAKLARAAQA